MHALCETLQSATKVEGAWMMSHNTMCHGHIRATYVLRMERLTNAGTNYYQLEIKKIGPKSGAAMAAPAAAAPSPLRPYCETFLGLICFVKYLSVGGARVRYYVTPQSSQDGSVAASLPTAARSNNSHGYELLHWL